MIKVLLFAAARQAAGCAETQIEGEQEGWTVEEFWRVLTRLHPVLGGLASSVRLARNCEYLAPGERIFPGDEVALIPPVSGG